MNDIMKIHPIKYKVFPIVLFFFIFIIIATVNINPKIMNNIDDGELIIISISEDTSFFIEKFIIPLLFLLILLYKQFVLFHHFLYMLLV